MRSIVRALAGDSTITSVFAMDAETVFLPVFAQFPDRMPPYGARRTTISERDTSTFCQIARIAPLRLDGRDRQVRAQKDESTGPPSRVLNARRWCLHRSVPRAAGTPEPGRFQELRQMTGGPDSARNRTRAPQQYRPQSPQSLLHHAAGR